PTSMTTKMYRTRKCAVTTVAKSQAIKELAWFLMKVFQRCPDTRLGPESKSLGQYFLTVRGDTRIPSLSESSSATRSCPQVGLLVAISAISRRMSFGSRGLPARDRQLQNSLKPLRCQRIRVSGLTITRASFQSNSRDQNTRDSRAASFSLRGRILCS